MGEIRKLEQILEPHIDSGWHIINYKCDRLTVAGENYGSLMLSLEVKLRNSKNEERLLPLVAKMIPENLWLRKMFKVQETFVKEMNFYDKVLPALRKFQLEEGVKRTMDFFPKYFGGRINLNPDSTEVDEDGIIILENLKPAGYVTGERTVGFNKEVAEFILKDLAVLHAVPIAFKMKKPQDFEKEIKAHIKFVRLFDVPNEEMIQQMITKYENFALEDPKCTHVVDKIKQAVNNCMDNWGVLHDGPFATITHNDFWVNNTMLKFDENGKPISNKMVDFQVVDYGSLGKDLIFFLFSSVQPAIVAEYYEHFLKLYHDKFIETLTDLHCDTAEYTFEALEKELNYTAKNTEFFHCLMITQPMAASPSDIPDLKDLSLDGMIKQKINPLEKLKVQFIVREFAKRNWI